MVTTLRLIRISIMFSSYYLYARCEDRLLYYITNSISMFRDRNRGGVKTVLSALIAVASLFIIAFYAYTPSDHILDASAQSNTTATNQTIGVTGNQTMQNQTGGPFGNLTRTALDPIFNFMNEARESLYANDSSAAYVRLNRADSSLFATLNEQNSQLEQFQPVKSSIENAKDALAQKDNAKALEDLNSASLALFTVTQQLPATEGEGAGTEEGIE
jgi:hypothetical protein